MSIIVSFRDLFGDLKTATFKSVTEILDCAIMTSSQKQQYIKAVRWFEWEGIKPMSVQFEDGSTVDFRVK